VNESLKLMLRLRNHDADAALSNASNYFLCAGLGGAVAAFVTSPLDVVKTRLQTQCSMAHEAMNPGSKPKYAGLLSAFQGVLQEQGLRGLMRGVGPRVLLAAPAAAISWGTYETICSYLSRINSEASSWREKVSLLKAVRCPCLHVDLGYPYNAPRSSSPEQQ